MSETSITRRDLQNIIQSSQGQERYVTRVRESELASRLIKGAQSFEVRSRSRTCDHNPPCKWDDTW